jgi:hypothetical protein
MELASPPPSVLSALAKRSKQAGTDEPEAKGNTQVNAQLDLLRQVRAELQDLQRVLQAVRDGRATLADHAKYIERNRAEISDMVGKVAAFADSEVIPGDNVRHLENLWQVLDDSPIIATPGTNLPAAEQVRALALCDQTCDSLIGLLGHLTIPARLNDWLTDAWSGYLLSFHDLFSDELPKPEQRQELLKLLASVPGLVEGGLVDPASGLIFPYHPKKSDRVVVCVGLLLAYLVATGGIWLMGWLGAVRSAGVPLGASDLLLNWVLVILGLVTHYGVNRSKGGSPGLGSIPLGHPTCAIDARAGTILLKGLLMLIGFFGLLLLAPKGPGGHLDFFLVGYSLDSFVGIISSSLDQRATARGNELTKSFKAV